MIKLFRFFNTLNIDTALGAVSFVFTVAWLRNEHVELPIYLALLVSVLSIYNIDHLIDAYRLNNAPSSFRHSFYKKYFKVLLVWQAILAIWAGWVLVNLPYRIVLAGGIMVVAIGVYFLFVFNSRYKTYLLREVIVAVGYTLAVAIIPFTYSYDMLTLDLLGIVATIFFVALTNLWTFAVFEQEVDGGQNHHSIALRVGGTRLIKMAKGVIIISVIFIALFFGRHGFYLMGSSFIIIQLIYYYLLLNKEVARKNDLYRILGEGIFILPGLALLIQYAV